MSISLFSVAIIFLFLTIAAIEIYRGIKEGFVKSLLSLGTALTSLVLSLVLSPLIARLIVWIFESFILEETVIYEYYEELTNAFGSLEELVPAVLAMILSVIIFVFVFFVIRWTLRLLVSIVRKTATKKRRDDVGHAKEKKSLFHRHDKLAGGIAGALTAIIVTTVILTPVMGAFDAADRVTTIAQYSGANIWDRTLLKTKGVDTVRRYGKDAVGSVFYELGGKYIFNTVASAEIGGERVYLFDEADVVDVIVADFFATYKVIQAPGKATREEANKIRELGAKIGELKCCQALLAEAVSKASTAWLEDRAFFKVRKPNMPSLVEPAFNDILEVCAESNENNVKYNVATIANILAIVVECDLAHADISSYSDAIEFIENTGILNKINSELEANPYMEDIRVSSLTMTVISQFIDPDVLGYEVYDGLMENVADAINTVKNRGYSSTEEEAEILSGYAQKYIAESGIEVTDDFAKSIAEELLIAFESLGRDVDSNDVKGAISGFSN